MLNQFSNIVRVNHMQILAKRDPKRAVTTDQNGEPIQANDAIQIRDPLRPENTKRGSVLHIYKSFVFIKSREIIENGGVAVTSNNNVVAMGAKKMVKMMQILFN